MEIYSRGLFFVHRIQKLPRLLAASSDGFLYIYNVDPQDGGECVLVQKHRYVLEAGLAQVLGSRLLRLFLLSLCRLFETSGEQDEPEEEESPEDVCPQPASQSYAATVALPSTPPSSTTLIGNQNCNNVRAV